ncbi:hypothetical protein AKJ09_02668 [Labilithrix luteola]|uniref:Uncharacterized protein n=1 Tax=Labilithrix luteola TaxID=1391654 RepID=A0A0K1PS94_9BACT|nr:hypothetical protein [Labilithrix luteola]AKU96004.1 hypothetical protein AKJ09_02668 [Labilithrix luteola]
MLFPVALCLHVLSVVLGLGQVAGIAVIASATAPRSVSSESWSMLERLARTTRISLPLVLVSGVLLESSSGGANHTTWWFRLSLLGFVLLGVTSALLRSALRKRDSAGDARTRERVLRAAWSMCAITAVVAVLMEVKPW